MKVKLEWDNDKSNGDDFIPRVLMGFLEQNGFSRVATKAFESEYDDQAPPCSCGQIETDLSQKSFCEDCKPIITQKLKNELFNQLMSNRNFDEVKR